MSKGHRLPNYERPARYEFVRQASAIFRKNGLSINGRFLKVEGWHQYQFEMGTQHRTYDEKGEERK